MRVNEFLSELGLAGDSIPTCVRWFMAQTQGGGSATARLEVDEAGAIEFGLYESLGGESSVSTGKAVLGTGGDEISFRDDDDAMLFERFVETVRLMQQEVPQ